MSDDPVIAQHLAPDGPVAFTYWWLHSVIVQRDYLAAWQRCTFEFRLARAQAWIYNNATWPDIAERQRDELAAELVAAETLDLMWAAFARTELDQMHEAWSSYAAGGWGAATRPRPIDLDHEVVLLLDTAGEEVVFEQETLLTDAKVFTVRSTLGGWQMAAFGDRLPVPGWPPTF